MSYGSLWPPKLAPILANLSASILPRIPQWLGLHRSVNFMWQAIFSVSFCSLPSILRGGYPLKGSQNPYLSVQKWIFSTFFHRKKFRLGKDWVKFCLENEHVWVRKVEFFLPWSPAAHVSIHSTSVFRSIYEPS